MKRSLIIGIIVVLVLVVILSLYLSPSCAGEGERFSSVYKDRYPEHCCEGLKEWGSGMDTSISIEGKCYKTMMASGNPVGTCINCGNGICENIENLCNCPDDCTAGISDYATAEDFCREQVGLSSGFSMMCKENPYGLAICKLCEWD